MLGLLPYNSVGRYSPYTPTGFTLEVIGELTATNHSCLFISTPYWAKFSVHTDLGTSILEMI